MQIGCAASERDLALLQSGTNFRIHRGLPAPEPKPIKDIKFNGSSCRFISNFKAVKWSAASAACLNFITHCFIFVISRLAIPLPLFYKFPGT